MKKAVIYDKWLSALGGGEVVACYMARILKELGFKVTLISGKKVSRGAIYEKFKVNLDEIEFIEIWDDEIALKKIVQGSEIFINISFMDYSRGFAKKNFYYVHFPTKLYFSLESLIINRLVIPLIKKFGMNFEPINAIDAPIVVKGQPAYILSAHNKYALSNLTAAREEQIEFSLFIENLDKKILEGIDIKLENGTILDQKIEVYHLHNVLFFTLKIKPNSATAYLNIEIEDKPLYDQSLEKGAIYLFYPKIYLKKIPNIFFNNFREKINIRIRAGLFTDHRVRLNTYQTLITHSEFVQNWIKHYWKQNAKILYPPADLLFQKYNLDEHKKQNWICSVGRFFTLGHGKKQEVLIEAFKKIYEQGYKNWELHLVGGLGKEPTSIEFFKYLREISQDYPVFFHVDASKKELEEVYLKSKIYWHATGFGEKENVHPVRFEHFGITPVEAVSAGCIPILYNGGGLIESIKILELDPKKHLFKTIDELVEKTLWHINSQKSPLDWKKINSLLEANFSNKAFKKRFIELIND